MSKVRLTSERIFAGNEVTVGCDAKCAKAFGKHSRLKSPNSLDKEDFEFYADDETGIAPQVTGNTVGGDDKPQDLSGGHNKWCVNECERAVTVGRGKRIVLPDFSKRVQS